MQRLAGKVALITGAASGIGKATALLFASEGASVALVDRSGEGRDVVAAVESAGGKALFLQEDLTVADAEAIVAETVRCFGGLDVFFGNAGINPHLGDITETGMDAWDRVTNIDLRAQFALCKAVVPPMEAGGGGSIILNASISGPIWGADHSIPYGAAKAGTMGLVRSLAAQVGPRGENPSTRRAQDRLSRIRQIALTVSDVPSALAFYRDVLGLEFLFSAGENLAFLAAGDVRIMLTTPQGAGTPGANSILYFAVSDIGAVHAALLARGAKDERGPALTAKMPDHELWTAFVRDPEGNLVGLMEERR